MTGSFNRHSAWCPLDEHLLTPWPGLQAHPWASTSQIESEQNTSLLPGALSRLKPASIPTPTPGPAHTQVFRRNDHEGPSPVHEPAPKTAVHLPTVQIVHIEMTTRVRCWSPASPRSYHLFSRVLHVYSAALLTRPQSVPWIPKLILTPAGVHFGSPSPPPSCPGPARQPPPALCFCGFSFFRFHIQVRSFPPLMAVTLCKERLLVSRGGPGVREEQSGGFF